MDSDPLVARLRAAGCVFAEDEAAVLRAEARDTDELASMTAQRVAGVPLEHVVGVVSFAGERFGVGPGVFVPRPRSEFLVAAAVTEAPGLGETVVDLCTGIGAIGLAVAARRPGIALHLTERDPAALGWARRNAERVPAAAVHAGDLWGALPPRLAGTVRLATVVAPYVPHDELALLPHEARDFEPALALDGGVDGLDVLRRIASAAPQWLAPGERHAPRVARPGVLLAEVGERQAEAAAGILAAAGLAASVLEGPDGETVVRGAVRA